MAFKLSVFELYLKRFITFVFISKHKKHKISRTNPNYYSSINLREDVGLNI